jgi:hypothetical protein
MGRPKGSKNVYQKRNTYELVNDGKYASVHVRDKQNKIKGRFLIDAEDLPRVLQYSWNINKLGYPLSRTREGDEHSKTFNIHRFLMNAQPGDEIDHINRQRTDNRKSNLRFCNHSENMSNEKKRSDNTTGCKGVSEITHRKTGSKWHAYIDINGKRLNKKCATFEEAVAQRKAWEMEHNPSGLN